MQPCCAVQACFWRSLQTVEGWSAEASEGEPAMPKVRGDAVLPALPLWSVWGFPTQGGPAVGHEGKEGVQAIAQQGGFAFAASGAAADVPCEGVGCFWFLGQLSGGCCRRQEERLFWKPGF